MFKTECLNFLEIELYLYKDKIFRQKNKTSDSIRISNLIYSSAINSAVAHLPYIYDVLPEHGAASLRTMKR